MRINSVRRGPRRLTSVLATFGLMATFLAAAVAAPATANAMGGPAGGFVIPAGSVAHLTNALFNGGAVNDLAWGYSLNGGPEQVMNVNSPGTDVPGPDVTIPAAEIDQTIVVFLTDNTCGATYYSDGTPVDHVTIQGSNPYSMDFFDSGGGCWAVDSDRHESGFNFRVDLTISADCSAEATVPGPPTNVVAYPGDSSAVVTWSPPDSDGGAPVQSYTVNYVDQPPGGAAIRRASIHAADSIQTPDTTAQFTGLTNGDTYTFTVQANNCVGPGAASDPSNAIVPAAGSSATVIGGTNLTQTTGTTTTNPTPGDTTIGNASYPSGTTGIGTLVEINPASGSPLRIRGATPVDQFCGGVLNCIGNVLQAELHNGALGPNPKGGLSFYKLTLLLDKSITQGLGTAVQVWYDGNLTDDSDGGGDPTPPYTLGWCAGPFNGTPCIVKIVRTLHGNDLKIVIKTQDLDPRLSTSR